MKSLSKIVLFASVITATGCSTIVNGTKQPVSINSNVPSADITVNGISIGQTPYAGPIARSSKAVVQVSKEGYVTKTATLDTSFEPIFWGNIIFGGILGSTTDAASGSMYKYAPATVQIDLEKKSN